MGSDHPSVRTVVGLYDSGATPLTVDRLAAELALSSAAADEALRRLRACDFVTAGGDGYRPTVTAREFIELEDVDGPVIVDHAQADAGPDGIGTGSAGPDGVDTGGAGGAGGGDGG